LSAYSISDCGVSSVRGNRRAAEPLAVRSFHQFLGHDRAADVVGDGDRWRLVDLAGKIERQFDYSRSVTGTPACFSS
jgi:hypothetical protein